MTQYRAPRTLVDGHVAFPNVMTRHHPDPTAAFRAPTRTVAESEALSH